MYSIKKTLIPILLVLCGIIAGVLISGAVYLFTGFYVFGESPKQTIPIDEAESADVVMLSYTVLEYIKDGDFVALSHVIHPEYGVVLSPYATINLATDRRFSAEQIAVLDSDTNSYVWGIYNESGEPIELTPVEYFSEFIPAAEHLNASIIGINQIVRSGNALENITDVFPNVKFVDFHIPGDEQMADFNWSSLRLGFEEYDGYLRLVAIVYSKWTV